MMCPFSVMPGTYLYGTPKPRKSSFKNYDAYLLYRMEQTMLSKDKYTSSQYTNSNNLSFKHDPYLLCRTEPNKLTTKIIIRALRSYGRLYDVIKDIDKFANNIDICIAAVKSDGCTIRYMPPEIQKMKIIQYHALKQTINAPIYYNDVFVDYPELFSCAILSHIDEKLKQNDEFMMSLINIYPRAIVHASKALKTKEMIIKLFNKEPCIDIFNCYEINIQNDQDFVNLAIENEIYVAVKYLSDDNKYKHKYTLFNKITLINIHNYNGCDVSYFQYASRELKNNVKLMLQFIENGCDKFYSETFYELFVMITPKYLLHNHVFMNKAYAIILELTLKKRKLLTKYEFTQKKISENKVSYVKLLRGYNTINNKEIVKMALELDCGGLEYLPQELLDCYETVKTAIIFGIGNLLYASDKIKNDEKIVELVVKHDVDSMKYIGNKILENKKMIENMSLINSKIYDFASGDIQMDKIVIMQVLKNGNMKCDNAYEIKSLKICDIIAKILNNEQCMYVPVYKRCEPNNDFFHDIFDFININIYSTKSWVCHMMREICKKLQRHYLLALFDIYKHGEIGRIAMLYS